MADLATEIVHLLAEKKYRITTAESCTGGLIAGTLVDVPGISEWFHEGYITYSNEAKIKLVGVSAHTLDLYGAVSSQTVEEMARGAARNANAQVAIAASGIAGPGGGTETKPVGLVFLGCFCNGQIMTERHLFTGDRNSVRNQSVMAALQLLHTMLSK